MLKNQEPQLQFPVETIIRNFLFTTSQDIWVGYKLVPQGFPLNDLEFFEKYIEDGKGMFEHDQYEYHLVNIPNYFDIEEHIEQTIKEAVKGDFSDLGEIYFRQAGKILKDEVQMNEYETYLFVRFTTVVQVADPLEYLDLLKDIGKRLMYKMTAQHMPVTSVPIAYDRMEKQLFHDLSNYKEIERLTPQMIGRIFYYLFHRADSRIPERELSPIEMTEGVISNENGYLVVEQIDKKHYSIFVSLIELPMAMFGSAFVQNLQDSLSFPIETHARLSFNHEKADLRKIGKMANRIYEQDKEQGQIDGILDEDDVLAFGTERLQDLKRKLKDKDTRLCQLSLTFVLSATSKEVVEQRMKDLEFALDGTDYKIYRSVADQLTLFNQCLIGSNRTFRSYDQIVTTGLVADLGFDLKKEIGNVLVIFDEPSSYLNDDFISLVNKGRGAGIHAIFSPQTMADVDRINIHLKNQLVGNVNTFFIGKTNAPNEIEFWGNVMGTYNDIDVTDWLPEKENNVYQDGSVQETLELFEDEKKREGKEETEKEENKSSKSKMKFNPEAF